MTPKALLNTLNRKKTVEIIAVCLQFLTLATIVIAAAAITLSASKAAATTASARTYAVFVAVFNRHTQEARGGIAGTAFFTSASHAITAYHVLQKASFRPQNAIETVQIWLVHENEAAIELKPEHLSEDASKDLTRISLGTDTKVPRRYIFELSQGTPASDVKTEGFLAHSIGPVLRINAGKLSIVSVPRLSRLHAHGLLERSSTIHLQANDVKLSGAPCLRLSYRPVVGLSGGPVIAANGKVIGMNSFADPTTRAHTWAIAF